MKLSLGLLILACVALATRAHASGLEAETGGTSASPIQCIKQKDSLSCDLLEQCNWCIGSKVGTGCYPMKVSKILPSKYFDCDKSVNIQKVETDTCDGRSEASCIAPTCVWCTSKAVPASCYTPDQAKRLPKAVFQCNDAPTIVQ